MYVQCVKAVKKEEGWQGEKKEKTRRKEGIGQGEKKENGKGERKGSGRAKRRKTGKAREKETGRETRIKLTKEMEEREIGKMEKKILITGFEPFGGKALNPSWEAVKRLPDVIGDFQLMKLQVPVLFGGAARIVLEKAAETQPDVIICVGQAGGRSKVTPEVAALNLRDTLMADNGGAMPQDEPIEPDGPAAYFATLPIRKMVDAVKERGIPCGLSYSAGVYVCNDLLYTILHRYAGTEVQAGFIHVPYLPEQAEEAVAAGEGKSFPSMPLDTIVEALEVAIRALGSEGKGCKM